MNFVKAEEGFDASFWQDDDNTPQKIDFHKMKSYGADFVICRAGQNLWLDEDVKDYWPAAREAGLPRAAYWYFDPRVDPLRQADLFCGLFVNDRPEGRLWLDLEFPEAWGGAFRYWQDWQKCLERIKSNGFRAGVYTGYYWWDKYALQKGADTAYFGQYPLWLAWYTVNPAYVLVPRGWSTAMLWQDGTPPIGLEVGVESIEVDHNYWNGMFSFSAEWGTVPAPPPPTGETMEYKVVWNNGVARRTRPATSESYTGLVYPFPVTVEVLEDNIPDEDDPTNANKRWVKFAETLADGSPLYGASEYPDSIGVPRVRMEKVEEPEPAPEKKITKATVHFDDGTFEDLFPEAV
jgi:hypothetical protein